MEEQFVEENFAKEREGEVDFIAEEVQPLHAVFSSALEEVQESKNLEEPPFRVSPAVAEAEEEEERDLEDNYPSPGRTDDEPQKPEESKTEGEEHALQLENSKSQVRFLESMEQEASARFLNISDPDDLASLLNDLLSLSEHSTHLLACLLTQKTAEAEVTSPDEEGSEMVLKRLQRLLK